MLPEEIKRKNNVTIKGDLNASKTILFVHGFGTEQSSWDTVVKDFEDKYRIVLLDNVGAGNADPNAFVQHKYLNLDSYSQDLIDICLAFEIKDAIAVGHSAGGMISLLASVKQPEIFSKLILIGVSPRYVNTEDYHGGFSDSDLSATYRAVMANYNNWIKDFSKSAIDNPDNPELAQYFAETLMKIKPEDALTVLCSILQTDYRKVLSKVTLPTLLVQSANDIFVPEEVALYLKENIKRSKLVHINAKGHFPHLSAPEEVTKAIKDFV